MSTEKPHEIYARVSTAKAGFNKALKAIKTSVEKVESDIKQLATTKNKLLKKGWPETLGDHLEQEACVPVTTAEEAKTF